MSSNIVNNSVWQKFTMKNGKNKKQKKVRRQIDMSRWRYPYTEDDQVDDPFH